MAKVKSREVLFLESESLLQASWWSFWMFEKHIQWSQRIS